MSKKDCKESIYDKCAYKNCRNGRYSTGMHLFRFPLSTNPKCKLWVRNTGNTKLEKWSANSLRRAGLCADHFDITCFKEEDKKTLKRDAVPIRFNIACLQKESETYNIINNGTVTNLQMIERTQIEESIQSNEKMKDINEHAIASTSSLSQSNMMDEQLFQWPSLKTYVSPQLTFNIPVEEEDIMEWEHLEPPINRNIRVHESSSVINGKNNKHMSNKEKKSQIIIDSLKRENIRLRRVIKNLKFRLGIRQVSRKRTSKKDKKRILRELIDEQNLHPVAKAMINLQLHIPNATYTDEEKTLSQQFFYYSATALRRLRKAGCNFPAERTIRRWHEEYNMMPGFCEFIFSKLQKKISEIPADERICALKWDEMYIKSYEEYSLKLDQVEGLVDLGPLGRTCDRAKCVFVFCLDSINARHPWRQPLAYFLPGKCLKGEEIVILLKECLDRLEKTGADVRLVTCDQGTCNQSAYFQLGVDQDNPFFIHKGKQYYASYDFPHLIKRLVSLLRKHKYLYCNGKLIASYNDFELTWSVDDTVRGGSNLLSHITEAHIHPNTFEAMNVKRAFQLLSHKFAAAIRMAGYAKQLQTNTWEATADFTERINKVIDACNSYSYNVKFGGKRLLSPKNPDIENLLRDFVEWCSRWSTSPEKILQIPCLKGFSITVQAILEIYNSLKMQYGTFQLATGLCNQDSVEHLFSKLRQRGGFNPNPTARMVRLALRHILCTGYIQTSDKGNVQCPEIEAECLINPPSRLIKMIEKHMTGSHIVQSEIDSEDELFTQDMFEVYDNIDDLENLNPLNTYDQNAVTFFAGYIARKSIMKTNCANCRDVMMKTPMDDATENEKYIEFREYPNSDEDAPTITKLIRPTDLFTKIIETQLLAFNYSWQYHWASTKILEKITNECVNVTNSKYPGWFNKNNTCYKHRFQTVQYMIRVKLYSRTRYNNRAEKRIKSYRKVKKLLNK